MGYAARSGVRESRILLANDLILSAQSLDLARARNVLTHRFNDSARRDPFDPPFYTSRHVLGQAWADDELSPLKNDEMWNTGRRASNTGVIYPVNDKGLPQNPFFNYGINGRGVIGRYGPNHAVDIAPCRKMIDENGHFGLSVLGITRRDTHRPALCGGFVDFNRASNGTCPYPRGLSIKSHVRELFEEVISGSVWLIAPYADGIDHEVEQKCNERIEKGEDLTDGQRKVIHDQVVANRKWNQIRMEDPAFLARLTRAVANGQECYAGSVMGSVRNTNNAWMETRLSWFDLDHAQWCTIKGDRNRFDYYFSAGDDAESVKWHQISPELIHQSGDHGAFFCYVLASYMLRDKISPSGPCHGLDEQAEHIVLSLKTQLEGPMP